MPHATDAALALAEVEIARLDVENRRLQNDLDVTRAGWIWRIGHRLSQAGKAVKAIARLAGGAAARAFRPNRPGAWASLPALNSEGLQVVLKRPLPEQMAVGRGTMLWLAGWCYHPSAPVRALKLLRDGTPVLTPVRRLGRSNHQPHDHPPETRCGPLDTAFLAQLILPAVDRDTTTTLQLVATLADGTTHAHDFPPVQLLAAPAEPSRPDPADTPLVAVCMATYDPPPALFAKQVESVRRQTHGRWVCLINDDCTPPDAFERLKAIVGPDPRFRIEQNSRRLGFYRNFERCLERVPPEADFVALSDHDDEWYPDKLTTLLDASGPGVTLAYADMRIVDPSGQPISNSFWEQRRNQWRDLEALLLANTVTGAASLFPRRLLDRVLPFPPEVGTIFHDHWIAAVALASGRLCFIDRPLHDYVQHGANVIGHAGCQGAHVPPWWRRWFDTAKLLARPAQLRHAIAHNMAHQKAVYYLDVLRIRSLAQLILLRCGDTLAGGKRRAVRRVARLGESWRGLLGMWWRGLLRGGRRGVTLGSEGSMVKASLWARLLPAGTVIYDALRRAVRPATAPDRRARAGHLAAGLDRVHHVLEKTAPLRLAPQAGEPRRINFLIPALDFRYLFGGYITKLHLAQLLARAGERVRLVLVDPSAFTPDLWRQQCRGYPGLENVLDVVELFHAADRSRPLPVNPRDGWLASTWWTAHIAHAACQELGRPRFSYLIQEYESYTFPMGSYAALSDESYSFPHDALFSTELLEDHFRANRFGVFAQPGARHRAFRNTITRVGPVTAEELANRPPKRLLVYARPEAHAARNMYETAVVALARAVRVGAFPGWQFHGIGAGSGAGPVRLAGGEYLELLPRQDQSKYADTLRGYSIGLALMYTPHPSLVPLEMAAAGLVTVTNTCGVKTRPALESLSGNLIAAEPTVESIVEALRKAAGRVEDYPGRSRGSRLDWPTSPEQAFPPALLDELRAWMRGDEAERAAA